MTLYVSRALSNVIRMADGPEPWSRYHNDLSHWVKHARPLLLGKIAIPAEIPAILSEGQYLAFAKDICWKAAQGFPATEVTIRESHQRDTFAKQQFLVWYQPPGVSRGLFLVVNDCGDFGELVTMFPPVEGRSYYDRQSGQVIHQIRQTA